MSLFAVVTLSAAVALTSSQNADDSCANTNLGLSLRFCQPCGSPGLDDFCIKRYGVCGNYQLSSGYSSSGSLGGSSGLPPVGYLSDVVPPITCDTLTDAAFRIPNRNGINGTIPAYLQAGDWGRSLPRVSFNPAVLNQLEVQFPLHHCLENNAPFPNGRWNWANPYDARAGTRVDSFFYNDNGNSTWSYQCYCDFCHKCQSCTNG